MLTLGVLAFVLQAPQEDIRRLTLRYGSSVGVEGLVFGAKSFCGFRV